MARSFSGISQSITCTTGALASTVAGGITIMTILKLGSTSGGIFQLGTTTSAGVIDFQVFSGDFYFETNDSNASTVMPAATTDNWTLVGASKATGTVVPRGHKYVYDTGVVTHANGPTAVPNASGSAGAGGVVQIGAWETSDYYVGDIAIMGVWLRVLSDAEVENLAFSLQAWYASAPDALWLLDQADVVQKVIDATGNGANQSAINGTTVSTNSVPVFSYGFEIQSLSSSAATGGATTHVLAGVAASTTSATGAITSTVALAGAAASTSTASGALTDTVALSGTAASTTTATGALTSTLALAGVAASTSAATGALTSTLALAGAAASTSAATGALTRVIPLAGTAATVTSATGDLTLTSGPITHALAGVAASTTTATGALTTTLALAGTAATTTAATGALTATLTLAGVAASTSAATGALTLATGPLTWTLTGTATTFTAATGALTLHEVLAGAANTFTAATGALGLPAPAPQAGGGWGISR